MGLLQPEAGLLFWMLLSFIVVFVILAKYGFPVITKMVEERRVFVEKSLEAAKEAKAQLDNIKTESEALLQSAREEQMKILSEAAAAKERIISQAKNEASIEAQKTIGGSKTPDTTRKGGGCTRSTQPDRLAFGRNRRKGTPKQTGRRSVSNVDDQSNARRNARHETIVSL